MTPKQIMEHGLQEGEDYFAVATIVRTAGTTAAKPGAKALLREDGTILEGWLGGGCVKGAIKEATLRAYATGQPQFISVAPEEDLEVKGVKAGDDVDGVRFARNGCPSKGTIDIFIEPHLPEPDLLIFGQSPVAAKLLELAPQFGWAVAAAASDAPLPSRLPGRARYLVIATQGQGDLAALQTGLADTADYVAFVGSTKKFATLSDKLASAGINAAQIAAVHAPAGLNIGAVTPAEIALSILAELTQAKRAILAKAATR
ncbi:XdhC family protein [Litoreibacter janthinus]|uniref:Xanthine dehydrogenase accessory factor n=1 Tax=Litoreibacter janthinus TaxID=670154 RepID=A0A1I6GP33_9RHOB|nr:XdhC family protein [Litoreibacter janthinus]SFR43881.1 xanthine dehydrogenase accessory factor [Litoreibacter janthinus]